MQQLIVLSCNLIDFVALWEAAWAQLLCTEHVKLLVLLLCEFWHHCE